MLRICWRTLVWLTLAAAAAFAQPRFDSASVRYDPDARDTPLSFAPGRVAGTVPLRKVILEAFHISPFQLSGGPAWINSEKFAIEGKAATPASKEELRPMLQTLLADRFRLSVRREIKEVPVYALTVAKGGPRFREFKPGDAVPTQEPPDPGLVRIFFVQSMHDFAEMVNQSDAAGRPVLDQTGLSATYVIDFQIHSAADLIESIEDQSGLRFEPRTAPLDSITIQHIERPDPN